jgi:hypothetical protein
MKLASKIFPNLNPVLITYSLTLEAALQCFSRMAADVQSPIHGISFLVLQAFQAAG